MPKYLKRVQVLLTEEQLKDLQEIASQQGKKLGTLVREAIEEYHLKKKKEREIFEAANRILSFPPTPVPREWEEIEEEVSRLHRLEK